VLVVIYDAPLPADYLAFADEPDGDYAWACRLALAGPGEAGRRLEMAAAGTALAASASAEPARLPHGLQVLRFLVGAMHECAFDDGARRWRWRRDG
jgi:hypothetical protein